MALCYRQLAARYGLPCRGLIHAGAHLGQEYADYKRAGVERLLLFEPQPHVFAELARRLGRQPGVRLAERAVGPAAGRVTLHVEADNQGMSSSPLPPAAALARQYPWIHFRRRLEVEQVALDDFLGPAAGPYDGLVLDVQGYELHALRGAARTLGGLHHVVTEVSRVPLYEGGALVGEVDAFLAGHGFVRAETCWEGGTWGDALYLRPPVGRVAWLVVDGPDGHSRHS